MARRMVRPPLPRSVIDTSSLVPVRERKALQRAARIGGFVGIWSPWIVAELNRVLSWLWIERSGGDLSQASRCRCSDAATTMMNLLLPTFELVAPLPPYPSAWATLRDARDQPIWAAAVTAKAGFVVSENRRDYPPVGDDGWHRFGGVEYLPADAFLTLVRS